MEACGVQDTSVTSKRKKKEKQWMLKLRAVFPYGLNNYFIKKDSLVLVASKFLALFINSTRISWIHAHKLNTSLSPDALLNKFKLRCEYIASLFVNKDHNYVSTGNLKIVNNKRSNKLFSKYQEKETVDYQKAKESMITWITSCLQSWCNK